LKNRSKGFDEGLIYWPSTPGFSSGYFALQNRPMLLIETPYEGRQSVTFNDSFIGTKFFRFICAIGIYESDPRTKRMLRRLCDGKAIRKMLKHDPELKKECEKRLAEDEAFRDYPYERLNFFY
jgi:hypothetical protein